MKQVILITASYPYGKDEQSFIGPELPFLCSRFPVQIVSRADVGELSDNEKRQVYTTIPKGIKVSHVKNSRMENILGLWKALFSGTFYHEIAILRASHKPHFMQNAAEAVFLYAVALRTARTLEHVISAIDSKDDIVFYTYWFDGGTLAAEICRRNNRHRRIHIITRVHGCDLYEERRKNGYQPYLRQMDGMVDKICFISQMGREYFLSHYGTEEHKSRYELCYLGTHGGDGSKEQAHEGIHFVSCSHLIPLKRVALLIEALSRVVSQQINWTHYGIGELEEELEKLAKEKLDEKENIHYSFAGFVSNEQIHESYKQGKYDAFLSMSSTEGIPVSMMEAFAYGMPVITTNVGGVTEIVDDTCGILLPADPTPEQAAAAFVTFCELSVQERESMGKNARKRWEERFDAEKNYKEFASMIERL